MASAGGRKIKRPPDVVPIADSTERKELERRYALLIQGRFDYRWNVSYVGNKNVPIHNWFPYKEGFASSLVAHILKESFEGRKVTLYDPFCGVGTTPVAGKYLGHPSYGSDLLPLAVFVSRVKLRTRREYNVSYLRRRIDQLKRKEVGDARGAFPDIEIIPKAFTPKIANDLLFIKEYILREEDEFTREFLLLGLISIAETVSHTIKDGLCIRLLRKRGIPSVRLALCSKLEKMYSDLINAKGPDSCHDGEIEYADVRSLPYREPFADLIITSPPYLNRYDYVRTYSIELALNFVNSFDELRELRHRLLRGYIEAKPVQTDYVSGGALHEILNALKGKWLNNDKIPVMIKAYFEDMYLAIGEMFRVANPGALVVLVVGNARFAGEIVPVDLILSEIAEKHGFRTEAIWITRYKGNASQQMARYERVPVRESIVFWHKPMT